ncbi:hypothetical protein ACFQGE_17750 [Halomicroarcula sp. GCM10025817]|uniref:hypothetical protein n=1 Tax=Haloarcula TaxID=2237 RepID=UPI0023E79047|nr:hypothetical protein [Halomicroarcula sp. SYNS111]
MSDSQAYETVTASADGVTVTKRFEEDDFPVPAIAFNVVSQRTEAVTLRLVDSVPDDVAVEDLGFHPEYGSEYWDITDDQITFERELEPESEYTTVYGIRATGTDDIEKFLTEPVIEGVDPPFEGDEDDIVGSTDDAIKDVISGEADSMPGLEDDEGHEETEDVETLDLKDPSAGRAVPEDDIEAAEDDAEAEGDDVEAAEAEAQTPAATLANGSVVAAMAAEIRNNEVSEADVEMLKRALEAVSDDEGGSGANTARINRIQSDIADLRAYTDALEEFLDEHGTGEELIEEFSERLDAFEAELDAYEADIEAATSTAEQASNEVEDVSGEVSELGHEVDDVEASLDDLRDWVESVEADVEAVRDELGDGEIDDRLSDLESDIEDLNEWREQLSSVIGGN